MTNRLSVEESIELYTSTYTWDLWATLPQTKGQQYIDEVGINIVLHQDSEDFELAYNIPHSVFTLNIQAGSFTNVKHFTSMYDQITSMVAILGTNPLVDTYWKTGHRIIEGY